MDVKKQIKIEYANWMRSRGIESQGKYKASSLTPKPKAPRKTKQERDQEKKEQLRAREEYLRRMGVNQPRLFMSEFNNIK